MGDRLIKGEQGGREGRIEGGLRMEGNPLLPFAKRVHEREGMMGVKSYVIDGKKGGGGGTFEKFCID